MDEINVRKKIDYLLKNSKLGTIEIGFNDLFQNKSLVEYIKQNLGTKGIVLYSKRTAVLTFFDNTNIRFLITKKKPYNDTDFSAITDFNIDTYGTDPKLITNSFVSFWTDVWYNKLKIILFALIFFLIYGPFDFNFDLRIDYENLGDLNDMLINIISIFIGTFFVFIGFFYSDKDKAIELYKSNVFDKYLKVDIYVFGLSLLGLIAIIVSNAIINIKNTNLYSKFDNYLTVYEFDLIKYALCLVITFFSITCLIICFDSITNYYFKKIRNNYFISAFEKIIEENKK